MPSLVSLRLFSQEYELQETENSVLHLFHFQEGEVVPGDPPHVHVVADGDSPHLPVSSLLVQADHV